jgi:hypothetical protein
MEMKDSVRQKLALLLAGENLESPQQLSAFSDTIHRTVTSWELYQQSIQGFRDRKTRYREYDRMDESSDVKASLDAYAEEVTIRNKENDRTVWIVSENNQLVDDVHDLFDQIKLEENIYGIARGIAKYGDDMERLYYTGDGLYHMQYLSPDRVDRVTDEQGRLRGYKLLESAGSGLSGTASAYKEAHPWDILHFKINGTYRDGWGESFLAGIAKTFRILEQLEIALALYRLHRAADRTIFYIDVGTTSNDQAYSIVEKWRQMYRKRKWFDAQKNEVDFKYNPIDVIEDMFWPVRPNSESRVDKLQGSNNVGDIADIEMFRNKLRYGLRIPKGYWGDDDGGVFDAKAGLVQQDMKFARAIERLQRAIIAGITKLIQIHLTIKGQNPNPNRFKVRMEPVSYLSEMQRMEALNQRVIVLQGLVEVGQALGFDQSAWAEYLMKKVMFSTDDEFNEFMEEQAAAVAEKQNDDRDFQDQSRKAELDSFNDAKAAATKRAKTPGGQSGVTAKSGMTKAKSKKPVNDDDMSRSTLVERDEILSGIDGFIKLKKEDLLEIKNTLDRVN